jgi:hypothetical protein
VESGEGGVGAEAVGAELGRLEDRAGGSGGPVEPALACLGIRERRLEELAHDAEGELALELAAARGEHAHVLHLGGRAQLGEQPALPDPGRTLDQREPAVAVRGVIERSAKRFKLAVALEEQLCPSRVGHVTRPS